MRGPSLPGAVPSSLARVTNEEPDRIPRQMKGRVIEMLDTDLKLTVLDQPNRGSVWFLVQRRINDEWVQIGTGECRVGLFLHRLGWTLSYVRERLINDRAYYNLDIPARDWTLK